MVVTKKPQRKIEEPVEGVELFPEAAKMPLFWATLAAEEKIVVNQGGTYSGKSQAIIRVIIYWCIVYPYLKAEVVGATIPKLTGDTLEIMQGIVENNPIVRSYIKQYNATTRTFFFKNGSKIIFKSYTTAKDADGPKRDILYLSEARNMLFSCVQQLMKRTKKKIYIDYNPVEQFWCHDKIINCPANEKGFKEYPSVKVIRSWHIHNKFISKEIHDSIENILDRELWKAYARGLTARVSGMCYPGWVMIERMPLCENFIWGMDIGYSNDPTVVVKVGLKPYIERIQNIGGDMKLVKEYLPYDYVLDELTYAPGITAGHIAKTMIENGYKFGEPLYMDHDNSLQRELRSLRIVAVKAIKSKGCIPARVLHLRTRRVAYTKTSSNMHEERKRYMFFEDKDGKITNEPKEGFDHAMNAAEYPTFTHAIRHGEIKDFKFNEENA